MGELSVHICDDAITIVGEMPIKLPKRWLHPELVTAFCKANYNLQGSVGYQSWLAGVFAGLALVIGPDGVPFSCAEEVKEPVLDVEAAGTVNIIMANSGEEQEPKRSRSLELLPGEIVVPGHTVIDGEIVQSIESVEVSASNGELVGTEKQLGGLTPSRSPESETIVPSAETPAAVGESIPAVSESPAVASEETRGLTPPGSPEPGAVSP